MVGTVTTTSSRILSAPQHESAGRQAKNNRGHRATQESLHLVHGRRLAGVVEPKHKDFELGLSKDEGIAGGAGKGT